jgi:predicted Rossmann fold nucleotide-binding protein DprA/Smf involved in DNA uptake
MKIGVTGHQNLPVSALEYIKGNIESILVRYRADLIGISSLAAGADQLFCEIVLKCGGILHIVIPCHGYEKTFNNQEDLLRYLDILEKARTVETLENDEPSEDAFLEAGKHIVDLSELMVAVWDGLEAKGKGGTGDIVSYALELGREIVVIWPPGVIR